MKINKTLFVVALLTLIISVNCLAGERKKIGLALSGGGARGAAHIGVLRVLEEQKIPIDYIAGTSMGSIIGGLYSAGYSPDEIETIMRDIDWVSIFTDKPPRPDKPFRKKQDDQGFLVKSRLGLNNKKIELPLGVLQGQHLEQTLSNALFPVKEINHFDDLKIPFRAVTTDLITGKTVVLNQGSLSRAIRASMSIPAILSPVEWDDKILVDGGITNNLPIDVVRDMGADVVIAVNISSPLSTRDELDSVLSVTGQLTTILVAGNVADQVKTLTDEDIYLVPDLNGVDSADFSLWEKAIQPGYDAAIVKLKQLTKYTNIEDFVLPHSTEKYFGDNTVLEFIDFDNNSNLDDRVLLARMSIKPGDKLNLRQLEHDISQIYGLDVFQEVSYKMINKSNKIGLLITANKKSWGPNYLQFGLSLADDFTGNNNFTLGVAYTKTDINKLGAELRIESNIGDQTSIDIEYYHPLSFDQRYFYNSHSFAGREYANLFESNDQVGEVQLTFYQFGIGVGLNINNNSAINSSLNRGHVDVTRNSGTVPFAGLGSFAVGEFSIEYQYDTLDNLNFPKNGSQINIDYTKSLNALGSDDNYLQYSLDYFRVATFNKNTLIFQASGGYTNDDNAPLYTNYSMGGFGKLSGLYENQLRGPHFGFMQLVAYREINSSAFFPLHMGFTIERGNIWQERSLIDWSNARNSFSLFIGADTFIGPTYFGYGRIEGGQDAIYLFLGNPFGN